MGLIMLELHPSSLLFVSLFGLIDAAVQVLFGATVGAYVDRSAAGGGRGTGILLERTV